MARSRAADDDEFRARIALIDRTPQLRIEADQRDFGKWFRKFAGGKWKARGRPRDDAFIRRACVLFEQAVAQGRPKSLTSRRDSAYDVVALQLHVEPDSVRQIIKREKRRARRLQDTAAVRVEVRDRLRTAAVRHW